MLGLAKRNIEQKYNENKKEIDNIIITRYDIERILNILNLEDNIPNNDDYIVLDLKH